MKKILLFLALTFMGTFTFGQDLYDLNRVREVKLTFSESNWDELLDANKQEGDDVRILAKLTFDGVVYDSVGVRYKGNSSYFNPRKSDSSKLPFNIKVDHVKKKQTLPGGFGSLKLSNVFRDPSYIREVLSYEIANKYMVAPRANFVKLYVNDELLGLYNSTESVDKEFLEQYFGYGKGVTFKCDPSWEYKKPEGCGLGDKASLQYLGDDPKCYEKLYEIKSKDGWEELIRLTKILNQTPEKLEEILDVDATLWMLAFNNVLVNLDSYTGRLCHNYYLYQDTFGIFHPIPWDMNLSFGGFGFVDEGRPMSTEDMQTMSPFVHYSQSNDKRPLITVLLKNKLYRKIYIAHMRTILHDFLLNDEYLKRARAIQASIDNLVQSDKNKLYPYESFKANLEKTADAQGTKIVGIKELMAPRTEYLKNHPLLTKDPPKISEVKSTGKSDDGSKWEISCRVSEVENVYLMYRKNPFQPWQKVTMEDLGATIGSSNGERLFQAEISSGKETQFYIIAEDAKTAALSPERNGKEFHQVK